MVSLLQNSIKISQQATMAAGYFIRWGSLFHDHRTLVERCTSIDSRERVSRPIKLIQERKERKGGEGRENERKW